MSDGAAEFLERVGRSRWVVALGRGSYYLVTGLWPVAHRASFEWVTGPKTDWWLVICVGLLAAAVGLTLLVARGTGDLGRTTVTLACAAAGAFLTVDVWFVLEGVISRIYLADGVVQLGLIMAWLASSRHDRS